MSEIFETLRKKHRLKHWGRLQLGLFLKAIGLKLAENIKLFESELKKTREGEKFINEYKYLLEHMYGKRGKKTDYSPWSCNKIANKAIPGAGEVYGCPFNYYSDDHLAKALRKKKLNDNQIIEVLKARKDKYHLGCRKLFEIKHENMGMIS